MGPYTDDHPLAAAHRRRHRIGRNVLMAAVFVGAVAACGTSRPVDIQGADPDHQAAIAAAVGSDRHLVLLSDEAARRAVSGSDRHLVNLAREIARIANAQIGSDRHLEELARQVASG